jgi:hypothetical protein
MGVRGACSGRSSDFMLLRRSDSPTLSQSLKKLGLRGALQGVFALGGRSLPEKVFTPPPSRANMLARCGRVAELADAKDLGFRNRPFLVTSYHYLPSTFRLGPAESKCTFYR